MRSNDLVFKHNGYSAGFVETFTPKKLTRKSGYVATVGINQYDDGTLGFSKPYFFFSEEFVPVSESVRALGTDGLERYIRAKKPVHTVLGPGTLICRVEAYDDGSSLIRGLQPLMGVEKGGLPSGKVSSVRLSRAHEDAWAKLAQDTIASGVNSRYDFLKYRIDHE